MTPCECLFLATVTFIALCVTMLTHHLIIPRASMFTAMVTSIVLCVTILTPLLLDSGKSTWSVTVNSKMEQLYGMLSPI